MIEIYHNNRCSKSRCTLDILNDKAVEFKVVEYLELGLIIFYQKISKSRNITNKKENNYY